MGVTVKPSIGTFVTNGNEIVNRKPKADLLNLYFATSIHDHATQTGECYDMYSRCGRPQFRLRYITLLVRFLTSKVPEV